MKFFIVIFFLLASLRCFAQTSVSLNVKLYPVQILSVHGKSNGGGRLDAVQIDASDKSYLQISSLSGYQVKMHVESQKGISDFKMLKIADKRKGSFLESVEITPVFSGKTEADILNLNDRNPIFVYTIISQ